jgi:beta-alanine degradation protein BauB
MKYARALCTLLMIGNGCTKSTSPPFVATSEPNMHGTCPCAGSFGVPPRRAGADSVAREAAMRSAEDPTVTDGDKYHVILENDRTRVLRYQDKPGDKTHPHHHVEFVLYALSPFRRRLTFPDGTIKERDFRPGDVIWMPEQIHIGENTGTIDTDVVIVERKRHASDLGARENTGP